MRPRQKDESPSVQGMGIQSKAINRQTDRATLGTACSCGGPGGRPGQAPICLPCWKFHRALMASAARQASCFFTDRGDADRLARCTS